MQAKTGKPCTAHGSLLLIVAWLQYHLLSLARDGIDVAVEAAELTEEAHKNALKASIHIVNADGSVDDDCAPLTMTIKARIYSLSAPRSLEIRHEYHRRQG
jgi:hypothetical protein